MAPRPKANVAVLISGGGSNLRALIEATRDPMYPARIAHVISNRPDAGGLKHAAEFRIPASVIDHKEFSSREDFDAALNHTLGEIEPDIVALAGFMRILTTPFVDAWRGRLVNIHPSLLPQFKGLHAQKQAIEAGATQSGCTVHWAIPGVDEGPIIDQIAVPVEPGDTAETLAARILVQEHVLYPRAIAAIARGEAKFPS